VGIKFLVFAFQRVENGSSLSIESVARKRWNAGGSQELRGNTAAIPHKINIVNRSSWDA